MEADHSQAGRWSYLSAGVSPDEVSAFERSCGEDPVRMLRVLGWRGSEDDATTDVARQRLRELRSRAGVEFGVPVTGELPRHEPQGPPTAFDRAVEIGCGLIALLLGLLLVIGVVSAVIAGFHIVLDWLG